MVPLTPPPASPQATPSPARAAPRRAHAPPPPPPPSSPTGAAAAPGRGPHRLAAADTAHAPRSPPAPPSHQNQSRSRRPHGPPSGQPSGSPPDNSTTRAHALSMATRSQDARLSIARLSNGTDTGPPAAADDGAGETGGA